MKVFFKHNGVFATILPHTGKKQKKSFTLIYRYSKIGFAFDITLI